MSFSDPWYDDLTIHICILMMLGGKPESCVRLRVSSEVAERATCYRRKRNRTKFDMHISMGRMHF
jgi:hypothetical protein